MIKAKSFARFAPPWLTSEGAYSVSDVVEYARPANVLLEANKPLTAELLQAFA